ncbi:MAG: hypothetical protein A2015_04845 [Spirochaetes bacterium GWF1_31_7]|nr:MAG: hypothetical protein A2Y30_05225 [Spirochaetes bacterium GWE1_32_154]OHD48795.1 MAG: hypothetical protein A2Y29_03205 [Spirochaetes bacterium GWE2_31_10]OHD52858.1 MAG: hypothetical protein A2015_04845 [Spirochaetes bacterium GWF1_31_7]OHD77216.1 MAG: hypothetical protein A2355_08785 [Spirochaetes bacterium RIFOXYB1_FULL_32_8]HBD93144.1 hypothetical protein [Spirochaetia bacterium]
MKMLLRLSVITFFFFIFPVSIYSEKKIALFPFENKSSEEYNFYDELIQNSLTGYLTFSNGYSIDTAYKEYCINNKQAVNQSIITAATFGIEKIISGEYYVENDEIFIRFYITDVQKGTVIHNEMMSGAGGILSFNTIEKIAIQIIEVCTDKKIETGISSYQEVPKEEYTKPEKLTAIDKNLFPLCFAPSGIAIYTKQYVKSSVYIAFFSIATLTMISAPIASTMYYYNYYLVKAEEYRRSNSTDQAEAEIIQQNIYNGMDYIFYGLLTGGISVSLILWTVSIIDSIIYYKKHITRNDIALNYRRKVNFSFEIRVL